MPTPTALSDPDGFWRELLAYIRAGRVIPLVGDAVVTFGAGNQRVSTHVASTVAGKGYLDLDASRLPTSPTLTDVACEWLAGGGRSSELYKQCYFACEEFERQAHEPGQALLALASIKKFNLFLTTTFDSLLVRALESARRGSRPSVRGFFPNKDPRDKDLPDRQSRLTGATVYHLFGQVSLIEGEYVLWEEDLLEFMCALHATFSSGKDLDLLSRDLADNALLVIGLNFSDLLVRLFLRIAKQRSLADLVHTEILAEHAPDFGKRGNILFFGGVLKNVHIHHQDPVAFALELAERWRLDTKHTEVMTPRASTSSEIPDGAIFISYAREDEVAASALAQGLQDLGCIVWYDRERLKAGGYFGEELKQAVEQLCTVFISLVSTTTEDAASGYWRRERLWAIERAADFYPAEFYIPIWVGHRSPPFKSEPEKVRSGVNAITLPDRGSAAFVGLASRLRALQVKRSQRQA